MITSRENSAGFSFDDKLCCQGENSSKYYPTLLAGRHTNKNVFVIFSYGLHAYRSCANVGGVAPGFSPNRVYDYNAGVGLS
jgi:hypothetical protein